MTRGKPIEKPGRYDAGLRGHGHRLRLAPFEWTFVLAPLSGDVDPAALWRSLTR